MPPELTTSIDWFARSGFVGLLALILIGGYRKMWVYGWAYSEKCRECEEYKALAFRSLGNITTAVSALEITAKKAVTP